MPIMVQGLIRANISSVYRLVDNLTEEQMQNVVTKAKEIVALVECEDENAGTELEHNRTE